MPSTNLTRRRVLAAVGAAGLAAVSGCANRLEGSQGDSATISFQLYNRSPTLRERYVQDLSETPSSRDEAALAAAVNGTAFTTQHFEPFPTDDPAWAEREGTYYRLDEVVVGEAEVTHPVLRLSQGERIDEESDAPEHVDRSDLPQVDQHAVQIAHMAARARGDVGGVPWGLVQRGGYVYRDEDAAEASELLDDAPDYVGFRDRVWEVTVDRETFHEAVYRPDAEPVAETEAEIEEVIRGRLVGARIDPDSLSDAERTVFREAREEYSAEHPFPDAFVSVLKRLDERAYIDGNVTKDAGADDYPPTNVIRYGDAYYEYRLDLDEAGGDA